MKKIFSLTLVLAVLASCLLLVPQAALADSVYGDTSRGVSFKVTTRGSGAYIVLSSHTGVARVAQHNWRGVYDGDGNEKTHGFYMIKVSGNGCNETLYWMPSATANKSGVMTCDEIMINMPGSGTYLVQVFPLSPSEAASYWRMDWIKYWVYDATWMVSIQAGCTASVLPVISP